MLVVTWNGISATALTTELQQPSALHNSPIYTTRVVLNASVVHQATTSGENTGC